MSAQNTRPSTSLNHECVIENFGTFNGDRQAQLFRLKNINDIEVHITDLGASIVSLFTPDRLGRMGDIVLGYKSAGDYFKDHAHMGAIAGRYAGRIRDGAFTLGKHIYQLARNIGAHHLHGGTEGFNHKLWQAVPFSSQGQRGVIFSLTSEEGEEGYPGTLHVSVTYTLGDDNSLTVDYQATTNNTTIINLTQHSYFNLSGEARENVHRHALTINSNSILETDSDLLPTGRILRTSNTVMDFKTQKLIGSDIDAPFPMLANAGGYDHTYVLANHMRDKPQFAAQLYHPESGRVMDIYTDQPALQFYTANNLTKSLVGKGGVSYGPRMGVCLETQNFPDAPNHPHFPPATLEGGELFKSQTVFRFGNDINL